MSHKKWGDNSEHTRIALSTMRAKADGLFEKCLEEITKNAKKLIKERDVKQAKKEIKIKQKSPR